MFAYGGMVVVPPFLFWKVGVECPIENGLLLDNHRNNERIWRLKEKCSAGSAGAF